MTWQREQNRTEQSSAEQNRTEQWSYPRYPNDEGGHYKLVAESWFNLIINYFIHPSGDGEWVGVSE